MRLKGAESPEAWDCQKSKRLESEASGLSVLAIQE